MRTNTTIAMVIFAIFALCLAASQPAMASDEEDALQVFAKWSQALNESDGELMASLYLDSQKTSGFGPGKEAAFLSQGRDAVVDPVGFSEIPPGTYAISSHNEQATMLGNNVAVLTRYFTGTYTDPGTKKQSVGLVRQTFVVKKIGEKWLIVHDHGSMLPTE